MGAEGRYNNIPRGSSTIGPPAAMEKPGNGRRADDEAVSEKEDIMTPSL
jgi:hypothetical protein